MSGIVLYGKPGCCLCDQAREALRAANLTFREIDIHSDDDLVRRYWLTIPVVEVGGRPVFEAGMDPAELADLVREVR